MRSGQRFAAQRDKKDHVNVKRATGITIPVPPSVGIIIYQSRLTMQRRVDREFLPLRLSGNPTLAYTLDRNTLRKTNG